LGGGAEFGNEQGKKVNEGQTKGEGSEGRSEGGICCMLGRLYVRVSSDRVQGRGEKKRTNQHIEGSSVLAMEGG